MFGASSGFHPYAYCQMMRWIVCLSAVTAAWRFAKLRWYVATAILVLGAILFNPVSPIRMSRFQWHPYDFWVAVGFLGLAILLGFRMCKMSAK